MIDRLRMDVRYGLRQLQRTPVLTLIASLSLAIGIGVAVTTLALLHAFIRPLPVPDPEAVTRVYTSDGRGHHAPFGASSYPDYLDFQRNPVWAGLAAERPMSVNLSGPELAPSLVRMDFVSPNYFAVLGLRLARGRSFSAGGHEPEIVISHQGWQQTLRGDPNVLGSTVRVNGAMLTVIGVAPKEFRGTSVNGLGSFGWAPAPLLPSIGRGSSLTGRGSRGFQLIGRLLPGITREAASARMAAVSTALAQAHPGNWIDDRGEARLITLLSQRDGLMKPGSLLIPLALCAGLILFVLLLACTNVAGLLLARAVARRHEVAVRLTLGASRLRLLAQLLTESMLLALMGGALGCLATLWLIDLASASPGLSGIDLTLDARVLLGALALSAFCALLFGIAPALQSLKSDFRASLGSAHTLGRGPVRLRGTVLAGQVAVSALLLVLALTAVRTVNRITQSDPGFDTEGLVIASIPAAEVGPDTSRRAAHRRQGIELFATTPGVRTLALAAAAPLNLNELNTTSATLGNGRTLSVELNRVSANFFDVVGIPFVRGRNPSTDPNSPAVVVNESFVRQYGQQPALTVELFSGTVRLPVVGVVRDVAIHNASQPAPPYIYVIDREPSDQAFVIARVAPGAERAVVAATLQRFRERFPEDLPPTVQSLDDRVLSFFLPLRVLSQVGLSAGTVELLLATIGLYGLLLFGLLTRTREIGLRLALGADRFDAYWAVMREGLRYAGIGAVAGVVVAVPITVAASRALQDARAIDPVPFLGALIAVGLAAFAAAVVPARRAARIEPAAALRHD